MAGAHCASVILQPSIAIADAATTTTTLPKSLKPPHSYSIFTPHSPRKLTTRKNYLRPKILKTLTKSLQLEPTIPLIPPPENDALYAYERSVNEIDGIFPVVDDVKDIRVSETEGVAAGEFRGIFGKLSANSVFKFGLGFVAVFLLQAICTVWILGDEDAEIKNKNKNVNGFDKGVGVSVNGGNKGNILMNKSTFFMEKTVENKINEIRIMAREAREIEAWRMRNGDEKAGSDDESVSSKGRIDIEKEIGARLVNVEKKFNSRNGKSPGFSRDALDEFEDDEEAKEADKTLMFKKKQKFRGPSVNMGSDVKGFSSLGGREVNEKRKSDLAGANGDLRESISDANSNFLQNDMQSVEKMPKEIGVGDGDTRFGTVQETSQGGSVEVVKARNSNLKMQNSQNLTKESLETTTNSKKDDVLDRNGGLKPGALKDQPSANITRANKSAIKSDFWWSNLPYVLAIVMRRGLEQEGAEGLFALRTASDAQDQNIVSYTVAFENHVDANNFCHLLESYFEDLGDFSTDIIPLSVKELLADVKSNRKMIVVKKGQLKLYAGQPFADVEAALLSLIDQ